MQSNPTGISSVSVGSSVTLTCDPMHQFPGGVQTVTHTCTVGLFVPAVGVCTGLECEIFPKDHVNSPSGMMASGTNRTLTCDVGFSFPSGVSQLTHTCLTGVLTPAQQDCSRPPEVLWKETLRLNGDVTSPTCHQFDAQSHDDVRLLQLLAVETHGEPEVTLTHSVNDAGACGRRVNVSSGPRRPACRHSRACHVTQVDATTCRSVCACVTGKCDVVVSVSGASALQVCLTQLS